ncbi:MAG: acyltransferase family protein [Candidatus Cloacimonetes bacterium]|nr:acyltransferase family protein [Candidatus Cloacimonadota bacterium]
MDNETKTNYNTIDFLKLIGSILVICIHTHPLINLSETLDFWHINMLCRIAVPFFFISSGYFFYKKIHNYGHQTIILKKYLYRIIRLYLFWSMIYFPFYVGFSHINLNSIRMFIMGFFLNGTFYHLWFFPALISSVLLVYFLSIRYSLKTIIISFSIIYIIGLFGDSYYHLSEYFGIKSLIDFYRSFFVYTRNGFFFGVLYVSIGAYISTINPKTFNSKLFSTGIIFCSVFYISEVYCVKTFQLASDYNMYLFLFPLSSLIFIKALNSNIFKLYNTSRFRDYSTLIYVFHPLPIEMTKIICFKFSLSKPTSFEYFIISLTSSILFIYLYKIYSKIDFRSLYHK